MSIMIYFISFCGFQLGTQSCLCSAFRNLVRSEKVQEKKNEYRQVPECWV